MKAQRSESIQGEQTISDNKYVNTIYTSFSIPLYPHQISQWRGAIATAAGWENDYFHNHHFAQHLSDGHSAKSTLLVQQKPLYRYPLIQYRVRHKKATIWAIGKGAESLRQFLFYMEETILLGGDLIPIRLSDFREINNIFKMTLEPRVYHLSHWLPFNKENYLAWLKAEGLSERIPLLESILVGNILSLATGIKWQLPQRLEVKLLHINKEYQLKHKGTSRVAMNLSFKANIQLPAGVALGKGVSHGFGVLRPFRTS